MAGYHLPECDLFGRNYRLELYSDLQRLPLAVPTFPGFPQRPDTSRCPQQPTCREYVVPSQAPHIRDFHPFKINRDHVVTYVPVSVSPSLTLLRGLGRTGEFHPRTPVVAVPAQLQAYGFGSRC